MKERIAVIEGLRTPFCKAGGVFKNFEADDLGAYVIKELLARTGCPQEYIDEVIFGNVIQPIHATNITRVLAVKAGLSVKIPAFTVNRNCSSGLESIITAANKIRLGDAEVILAGGTESMSGFPILFSKKAKEFIQKLGKAKTLKDKLLGALNFRPSFLMPEIPAIADPLCGLTMGQTAENIIRDFRVTRQEQDEFAQRSHHRAFKANKEGIFAAEIVPLPIPPKNQAMQIIDDGVREDASLESLLKLRPAFEPVTGSVTAGNSSPVTDGAAAVLLMKESKAKALGYKPLGYIGEDACAALDPARMGLGPYYAIAKLLQKTGRKLSEFDLVEINEAFAGQVLAVVKALNCKDYAQKMLNRSEAVGELNPEILNVNGGAIALGHPLGASGTRLVLTLLKELNRRNLKSGLVSLCIGGGQGEAVLLERE